MGKREHKGYALFSEAEPDEVIQHLPAGCDTCPLKDPCLEHACVRETRQVIDMVVATRLTADEALDMHCPLHEDELQKGAFPEEIKTRIQYGENLQALVVALNTLGAVSMERTHLIISSIFDIPLSTGTVHSMVSRCAQSLSEVTETIRQNMVHAEVGHFDETGTRVDGKTIWVHDASNAEHTYLTIHQKRETEGMEDGGVLPEFQGVAVPTS